MSLFTVSQLRLIVMINIRQLSRSIESTVTDLGVVLYNIRCHMESQVTAIFRSCFYQLWQLPVVQRLLTTDFYNTSFRLSSTAVWSGIGPFPSTTTFTLMILSSSSFSTHSTLTQAFLTFKTLFNTSLPGRLLIFRLLTPQRPNSCSSDSKTNLPKCTTLHLTPPTLLES